MRNVDELHQPKNVGSVSIELVTQPCRIALRCIEGGPSETSLPMPPNDLALCCKPSQILAAKRRLPTLTFAAAARCSAEYSQNTR